MASTGTYTEPKTMATGTTGTSTDWNTYVRTNMSSAVNRTYQSFDSTARVASTNYQNTTPGVLYVTVTTYPATTSTPQNCSALASIGSASTSLANIALSLVPQLASTMASASYACVTFLVPAYWWYKVDANQGSAGQVIYYWKEWSIS